jgi:O-antigen ligase
VFAFFGHLVYTFFNGDITLQLASIFIDIVFAALFLVAIFKFDYAFFGSLLLLPVFFLLENISIINQIYNSQSLSGLSFYAVDPRVIGFSSVIFFAVIFIFKKKPRLFKKTPLIRVIPVAILLLCLSAFWSVGGQEKYVQVSFYILLAILYFTTYFSIKGVSSFYRLIIFFIVLSIPAVSMAYFQIFGGLFFEYADMDIKRVSGPFNSPNLLGSFLLVSIALAIVVLVSKIKKNREHKWYLISYLFFAMPIFFLTFSRSAWIGIVVFLAIFSLQSKRFVVGALLSFTLLLSMMLMFESTRERVNGFSERTMFDSVYARTNIWRMSYKKFLEKPVLGHGAGSFSEVINDAKESAGGTDNPHNDVVFFAVEGGIVGVISFLSIIGTFYFYLIKFHINIKKQQQNKKVKEDYLLVVSLGVISLFVAMTVVSMVESYYEGNFLHLFLWSLLGGWFALAQKEMMIKND